MVNIFGKKRVCSLPMVKRMFLSIVLWILFWLFCAYLAWSSDATLSSNPDYWGSALMWNILFNRVLIWVVIAFAWFITFHPILKIRMYPALRWACLWALVSLDISFWAFISNMPNAWNILAATVIAWAIYGMIIDLVATKYWAEGKDLLEGTQK